MKNFKKVLSKTASVYTVHTYGFAIRGFIKRGVAKTLGKFYQTTGMQSIPEHHVNWGIGLRGFIKRGVAKTLGKFYQTTGMTRHTRTRPPEACLGTGMRSIPEHRIKRGVAL